MSSVKTKSSVAGRSSPFDSYDLFQSRVWMKHRCDVDEKLALKLSNELANLAEAYKDLRELVANHDYRALAHQLSQVEYQARCAGFAVNSILYKKDKVLR